MKKTQTIAQIIIGISLLIIATITLPCVFQKGGVKDSIYDCIAVTVFVTSGIIIYSGKIKKDFLTVLILSPVIIVLGFFLQSLAVEIMYGDKTWGLWEFNGRIIANTVFYGTAGIILVFVKLRKL